MLALAMERGASMTRDDICRKHQENMRKFDRMVTELTTVVNDASRIESPRANKSFSGANLGDLINTLSGVLKTSKEWSLDDELIAQGNKLMAKMEVTQDMLMDLVQLQRAMPIRTQVLCTLLGLILILKVAKH